MWQRNHMITGAPRQRVSECETAAGLRWRLWEGASFAWRGTCFFALVFWTLALPLAQAEPRTPGGSQIVNTATIAFTSHSQTVSALSNSVKMIVQELNTPAQLVFYKHAPQADGAEDLAVSRTYFKTAPGDSLFKSLAEPVTRQVLLSLQEPVPCVQSAVFHSEDYLFLKLTDLDENKDSEVLDTVELTLVTVPVGDLEVVRLRETDRDSGVFTGYVPIGGPPPQHYDGVLSVTKGTDIIGTYSDQDDSADLASFTAVVDPFGMLFDSATGNPVDGATVKLVNASTGGLATVYGDDGVSAFPATLVSGGSATDAAGAIYNFDAGEYRFPFVEPGTYRLEVTAPAGFLFPSTIGDAVLQELPGGPFALTVGSRGENFVLNPGPALNIDIPLDSIKTDLFVRKTAAKDAVAVGDFLAYRVTVENTGLGGAVPNTVLTDTLPRGFRYQSGSARVDGNPIAAPVISGDGRSLRFAVGDLAASATVALSYVVEVGAGARLGSAVNQASATGDGGQSSNVARATVRVREDLLRGKAYIMGQVYLKDGADSGRQGVPGVRVYLENGTYVVTDQDGLYHIEGVAPGVHVVQLDLESLPEEYRTAGAANNRFAGRDYSQFVDVQGGTLWRADFPLALREKPHGRASLRMFSEAQRASARINIELEAVTVPLKNVKLMVMLPESLALQAGSATFDGSRFEPVLNGNVLVFRLGETAGDWKRLIQFDCKTDGGQAVSGSVKAMLMVDTPEVANRRLPLAEVRLGTPNQDSGQLSVETVGVLPGEQSKAPTLATSDPADAAPVAYDEAWLENAKPGLDWLLPVEGWLPAIPSAKVVVKHSSSEQLTLLLNGSEVSAVSFDGVKKNRQGSLALSRWSGIDLQEGDNVFELRVRDREGRELRKLSRRIHYSGPPVRVEFLPNQGHLVADGRTPPVLHFRFVDRDGYPAREGVTGEFSVSPPYAAFAEKRAYQTNQLIGLTEERVRFVIGQDGVAKVKLEPTARSGEVLARFRLVNGEHEERAWLQAKLRDWILVGLAEGSAGYRTLTAHAEGEPSADLQEHLYSDGRIAFFAKGRVKGKWLLTLAYDNDKRSGSEGESLYQVVDPDSYYQLYGDATQQGYEAASNQKLFVKLERDQFYALFGDFDTGLTVTELSRYSRSLTGLKTELKGERLEVNAFASDTSQAFVKDEIRGDGTSGLYRLSRSNIVRNSEKVRLETRDRFLSQTILESQDLSRHLDYQIDYDAGTLFFKRPVMSRDANLDPIFIVVDYESNDGGDTSYNYGGRVAVKSKDQKLVVGASAIHEGSVGGDGNLYGADVAVKVSDQTRFRAEFATSDTDIANESASGSAYLAELIHRSKRVEGVLYFRQQADGFGLGQQSGSETGTRKFGGDFSLKLATSWSVSAEAYHQDNLRTESERDVVSADLRYTAKSYSLHTEILSATDRFDTGETTQSNQIGAGGSLSTLGNRLTLRLDRWQTLGGGNDQADYPTRTVAGADWRLNETVTLFAEEELTQGDNQDSMTTRIGLKTLPWTGAQLNTTIDQNIGENGARTFATLGLSQTWQLTQKWALDGSVDMSRTVQEPGDLRHNTNVPAASGSADGSDFAAVTLGASYREKDWSFTSRLEHLNATTNSKWGFFSGIIGQVKKGLTMSLSTQLTDTSTEVGNDDLSLNLRLGLAYRPLDSRWIVLSRTDLEYDRLSGEDLSQRTWRLVENLNANCQATDKLQVALQVGAKFVGDVIDGDSYDGFTDLVGLEARYDLTDRVDIGFRLSMLHSWQSGQLDYSAGPSLGIHVAKNMWVSVGYNLAGFQDDDFSRINYTAQGPFVQFRLKFDQDSVRALKQFVGF